MQAHQHVTIPLSKLSLSAKNVRTSARSEIKSLAHSIRTQGVLHNLVVVTSAGNGKERFEVVDGGRRFEALTLLREQGDIKASYGVPCTLIPDENAVAASLSANSERQQMHPIDELKAFQALAGEGKSIEDIAAMFGVTPLVVKRRLKLANVSPKLLAQFGEDKLDLETLMAFAAIDDHQRQEAVWAGLPAHACGAWAVKRALTENEVPTDDARVRFVGLKAYKSAGGPVRIDLFSDKNASYVQDVALIERLALAKLTKRAEQVKDEEGLSWVDARLRFDYSERKSFGDVPTIEKAPNAKQAGKLAALEADLAAATAKCEADDEDETAYEHVDNLSDKIEEIRAALRRPDPRVAALAGAVITLTERGAVEIVRGLVRAEDRKALKTLARASGESDAESAPAEEGGSEFSAALRMNLSAHFTAALRLKVASAPGVALRALTATLYDAQRAALSERFADSTVKIRVTPPNLKSSAPEIGTTKAAEDYEAQGSMWDNQIAAGGGCASWIVVQPIDTILSLLAHCVGASLDALNNAGPDEDAKALAQRAGLDMRDYWQAGAGDIVLLVAASFFSYYTVAAKPLIERLGGVTVMTYAVLLGSGPVVALSLPAGLRVAWDDVSPAIWLGMVYAVLISAFLGWLVWGWVNAIRGVARTAPLMYLMPPVAGLVAWAVTGERYTVVKLGGAALTLVGVALAQFTSASPRDPVREAPAPVD